MDKNIPGETTGESMDDHKILLTARRFILLVPDFGVNEIALGRKIWDLARVTGSDILFLGVVQNIDEEFHTLQRIASLFAVSNDRRIRIDSRLDFGHSWRQAILQVWQPGDVILCLEDHMAPGGLFRRKSLAKELAHELNLPVYCLPSSFDRRTGPDSASSAIIEKITRVQ